MEAKRAHHTGKRIFIPLLFDYYLFDYFRFLIPRLLDAGFRVTLYTFDPRVTERYSVDHPDFEAVSGSRWLRACHNRQTKAPFRTLLWLLGWVWGSRLKNNYDFAIVPWDNKPLWYIVSRRLPSLTSLTVTTFIDFDGMLDHLALTGDQRNNLWHRVSLAIDRLAGGAFVPKVDGRVLLYRPLDRIMGWRAPGTLQAFSGIAYFTVPGSQLKEVHEACGVGRIGRMANTRILVAGSPAYEPIMDLPECFAESERKNFTSELGLDPSRRIFTFFLSPSRFTEDQIEEVAEVVETFRARHSDGQIVLKFHPKTDAGETDRFRERLHGLGKDLKLITRFAGDEFNAKLILISDCIVQKQSTVGFIALMFETPIVSYNLRATNYEDDMYKYLGGSHHAETRAQLEAAIEALEDPARQAELRDRQRVASALYCKASPSPCGEIVQVIQDHFRPEQEDRRRIAA